jgi:hypothetical protein
VVPAGAAFPVPPCIAPEDACYFPAVETALSLVQDSSVPGTRGYRGKLGGVASSKDHPGVSPFRLLTCGAGHLCRMRAQSSARKLPSLAKVADLHPLLLRSCIIGNCQRAPGSHICLGRLRPQTDLVLIDMQPDPEPSCCDAGVIGLLVTAILSRSFGPDAVSAVAHAPLSSRPLAKGPGAVLSATGFPTAAAV